ncbi:Uncharacterized conserved protein, DUF1499 family [Rhodovulum sp. ES.010]|uniref:DUF1499 domain-containing protein n=1 Tax=Rhodovulum sp. ES.010 TaxID=1882821 RepID=UPI000928BA53|nr:DUF1499 domain-containing protein [Rhodovulum sp. ES.010]SIO23759.1 Uncharacterized conserved protein, DUF1499 family [Rhodovulum sp. ES.010]
MKILTYLVVILLIGSAAGAVYFRKVADDPETWHVDPITAAKPDTPNAVLVRPEGGDRTMPGYDVPPEALAEAIEAVALDEPRTERIGGSPDALWMTYVQRSRIFGFPDYISVKVLPKDDGATWAAFSRSRFGQSDLGVNAARLERWQNAVRQRLDG